MATKRFIIILAVIILAAAQFFLSIRTLASLNSSASGLRAYASNGTITVTDPYWAEGLIRLAPYQDFAFINSQRVSLKSAFMTAPLQKAFFDTWTWQLSSPQISYSYSFSSQPHGLELTRTVTGPVTILGQAIYICQDCAVSEEPGRAIITNKITGRSAEVTIPPGSTTAFYPQDQIFEVDSPLGFNQEITQEINFL